MKRILLVIICSVFVFVSIYSEVVDTAIAKTVARNFYLARLSQANQNNLKNITSAGLDLKLVHLEISENNAGLLKSTVNESLPLYYVFNISQSNGFVIISADDRVVPVLGYAFKGSYSESNQPPAFIQWMKDYQKQILYVISNKTASKDEAVAEWKKYRNISYTKSKTVLNSAGPLITTTWGQQGHYNNSCPVDTNSPDGRTNVGCVAVALGQILRYWEHPDSCTFIPGYLHSSYGQIPNVPPTTYNWSDMPNALNPGSSISQISSVSQLLYHCGVAVKMEYGPGSSGAYVISAKEALFNYFSYSSSLYRVFKSEYTDSVWNSHLINELDNQRPIFYAGDGLNFGHAFVCDGYQGTNYFHFNWGWNGIADGFFYLDNLVAGSFPFNENQEAIFGIYPDDSQPCPSTTKINGYGAGNSQTYAGGGSGQWHTDTYTACGLTSPGAERIYSFVAPATGLYSIQITEASGYVAYMWKAGTCSMSSWNCIARVSSPGFYGSMRWTAGMTYYIMLDDENNVSGTHTFYLEYNETGNPADVVTLINGCGQAFEQTYASEGHGIWYSTPCSFRTPGKEKMFAFTAPLTGTFSLRVTAASGIVSYGWKSLQCYQESGWNCIGNIEKSGLYGSMNWTAGKTYCILLDNVHVTPSIQSFYLICPEGYLNITPSIWEVSSSSGITNYSVNSNTDWSVSDNADWLVATKTNSNTISVSYEANFSNAFRTATITATGAENIQDTVTIKQLTQSSSNENIQDYGLKVYPNPATGKLLLNPIADINNKLIIIVSDNIGRLLYLKEYQTLSHKDLVEIDVSGFAHGIYYLKIRMSDSIITEKFIIK